MHIKGLQKLTLLDYPSKTACTVFTAGCNFRCPFCQNSSLVLGQNDADEYTEEQILSFLKKRQGLLDGVCITGGEPTLYADLPEFISKIKSLEFCVKLDTNATNPDMLKRLIEEKLIDYAAIDIKNSPEKYELTAGADALDTVGQSVEYLLGSDFDYEFRTTVVCPLHTPADLDEIGRWIKGCNKYFLQQYRDSGEIIAPQGLSSFTEDEMQQLLNVVKQYIPHAELRGL
jgi:pyruvate formate lyase activating enzyme